MTNPRFIVRPFHPGLVVLLIGLLCLGCAVSSSATHPDSWVKLGERTVDHRADRDEITVGVRDGDFRRIKVLVRHRAVEFRAMRVHYANGGVQDIELRRTIPAGGESRAIDLRGDDRVIEKVVFFYDTQARRGRRALVELYGLR